MWLFKLMGATLLACSGLAVSHELNRRASAALKQNEATMSLLRAVRGQIECFARPIPEILAACEPSLLEECGYGGRDAPGDLLQLFLACQVYDAETLQIAVRFAEEFGRGYREDEVRACDYALSLLEERRARLAADIPTKKKRNTVLSVCAALAVALLLL